MFWRWAHLVEVHALGELGVSNGQQSPGDIRVAGDELGG